jgi:hypothetical protein
VATHTQWRRVAEKDWHFGINRYHVAGAISAVGGLVFITAGLLGYDTARVPVGSSRWVGGPLWDRIAIGLIALGIGIVHLRRARGH